MSSSRSCASVCDMENVLIVIFLKPEGIFDQKGLAICHVFNLISSPLPIFYDNLWEIRNPNARNAGKKGRSKFQGIRASRPPCTSHLSDFAGCTRSSLLSGSGTRHTGRLATSFHKLVLVLLQRQTPRFHIARDCSNSLSIDTSIVTGHLNIFDVILAKEARYVRFCLMTVACGQKHVVNVHDDHSDEMSREIAQGEEGRVQFQESVSRSSFHHPRGESGNPKTPLTISIKAPFSIPGKPREGGSKNNGSLTLRFSSRKAQETSTPLTHTGVHKTVFQRTKLVLLVFQWALPKARLKSTFWNNHVSVVETLHRVESANSSLVFPRTSRSRLQWFPSDFSPSSTAHAHLFSA